MLARTVDRSFEKQKKAVGYVRTSSPLNPEVSIPNQIESIKEYCSRNNLCLTHIYADEEQSGVTTKRSSYLKLKSNIRAGNVDVVLTTFTDRLARDSFEFVNIIGHMQDMSVEYITVEELFKLSIAGPNDITQKAIIVDYENRQRAERIGGGKKDSLNKGEFIFRAPFGYKKMDDRKLVPIEPEAEMVREIFRLFTNGKTIQEIKGGMEYSFTKQKIRSILLNKSYTGVHYKSTPKVNNDFEYEPVIASGLEFQALVDESTFEHARKILSQGIMKKPRKQKFHLVRQRLYCGNCDEKMNIIGNNYICESCKVKVSEENADRKAITLLKTKEDELSDNYAQLDRFIQELKSKKKKLESQFATGGLRYETFTLKWYEVMSEIDLLQKGGYSLNGSFFNESYSSLFNKGEMKKLGEKIAQDGELFNYENGEIKSREAHNSYVIEL